MFYCTFLQFVFGFFKSLSCMPVNSSDDIAIMYMYSKCMHVEYIVY